MNINNLSIKEANMLRILVEHKAKAISTEEALLLLGDLE